MTIPGILRVMRFSVTNSAILKIRMMGFKCNADLNSMLDGTDDGSFDTVLEVGGMDEPGEDVREVFMWLKRQLQLCVTYVHSIMSTSVEELAKSPEFVDEVLKMALIDAEDCTVEEKSTILKLYSTPEPEVAEGEEMGVTRMMRVMRHTTLVEALQRAADSGIACRARTLDAFAGTKQLILRISARDAPAEVMIKILKDVEAEMVEVIGLAHGVYSGDLEVFRAQYLGTMFTIMRLARIDYSWCTFEDAIRVLKVYGSADEGSLFAPADDCA